MDKHKATFVVEENTTDTKSNRYQVMGTIRNNSPTKNFKLAPHPSQTVQIKQGEDLILDTKIEIIQDWPWVSNPFCKPFKPLESLNHKTTPSESTEPTPLTKTSSSQYSFMKPREVKMKNYRIKHLEYNVEEDLYALMSRRCIPVIKLSMQKFASQAQTKLERQNKNVNDLCKKYQRKKDKLHKQMQARHIRERKTLYKIEGEKMRKMNLKRQQSDKIIKKHEKKKAES